MADIYSTLLWQTARAATLLRDGYACGADEGDGVPCGQLDHLQVHHLTPVEEGGDPYDIKNLLTLCPSHHRRLHWLMKRNALA